MFLVLFKDGGSSVSPRFYLFVSGVNQGNEEAVCEFKIFLGDPTDGKILHRFSASFYKIENVLWYWKVGVCLDREFVELVIAGSSKVKFYDFYNLKLEHVMRNLTCGHQQILLMVIWIVPTWVETEEISY